LHLVSELDASKQKMKELEMELQQAR